MFTQEILKVIQIQSSFCCPRRPGLQIEYDGPLADILNSYSYNILEIFLSQLIMSQKTLIICLLIGKAPYSNRCLMPILLPRKGGKGILDAPIKIAYSILL